MKSKMKIHRKCKCGCGRITKPGNKWILGHARKGLGKTKIRRRCECGCGEVTNPGRKYIHGHYPVVYSEESRKKISISMMGNANAIGNTAGLNRKCSKKTRLKLSLANIGKKKSKESKLKMSISTIENWKDPVFQRKQKEARTLLPNKQETKLGEILSKLYPKEYKYVGDYQFFLGGKNPDFMNVNGQKKLVELYGDYWHAGEDEQNRIDHFKQYGFDTLIIWEHELKESRLNLRRKLKYFHIK